LLAPPSAKKKDAGASSPQNQQSALNLSPATQRSKGDASPGIHGRASSNQEDLGSARSTNSQVKLVETKEHAASESIKKPKIKPLKPWEFKRLVKSQKTEMHVKKNQYDFTAALVYGLNVSLIHFALFVMVAFVAHWPDTE
jgi:hypothetical protein